MGARGTSARAALLLALAPSCLTQGAGAGGRSGPYDELPAEGLASLREGTADWDAGQLRIARARLAPLSAEHPRNVPLGILVQELEIEVLERGGELQDLGIGAADEDWLDALRRRYRERAEAAPTPERLVLAARLEDDGPAAAALLQRALAADPRCAWAHYGLAHLAFGADDFAGGRAALERALELDPANPAVRRLQVRALQRSARREVAASALEEWLADTRGDPYLRPRDRAEAEFDLALLRAEMGRRREVEDLCAGLVADGVLDRAPVFLVLAAARAADGDAEGALDAARRASRIDPDEALAHVQRALVLEDWLERPERAFDAWAQALEVARGAAQGGLSAPGASVRPRPGTVRDVELWLQARTRLARLDRRGVRGTAPGASAPAEP